MGEKREPGLDYPVGKWYQKQWIRCGRARTTNPGSHYNTVYTCPDVPCSRPSTCPSRNVLMETTQINHEINRCSDSDRLPICLLFPLRLCLSLSSPLVRFPDTWPRPRVASCWRILVVSVRRSCHRALHLGPLIDGIVRHLLHPRMARRAGL